VIIIKKKYLILIIVVLIGTALIWCAFFTRAQTNIPKDKTQKIIISSENSAKKAELKVLPANSNVQHEQPIINNVAKQPKEEHDKITSEGFIENAEKTIFSAKMQKQSQNQIQNEEESEVRGRVLYSMKLAAGYINSYYTKNDFKGFLDWPALAVYSVERDSDTRKYERALEWKEKEIKEGNDFDSSRSTDSHRSIIGILSAGGNPRDFAGMNLVESILKSQLPNGKFADTIEGKGERLVNAHIWGIISLYSAGEKIPNPKGAYNWLISKQNSDGGFGILTGAKSDLDMTGMALIAFGALGKSETDENIKKAVEFIKSKQAISGGFEIFGQENPDTAATVVQGLISIGINPVSKKWTKEGGKNMIDFIMAFQLSDGAFSHTHGGEADMLATTRALTALADYYNGKTVFQSLRGM